MTSRTGRSGGFEEMEELIYRLFAAQQFALVMVAQLLSAQFLLLRLKPPSSQAIAAPSSKQRLDVRCAEGGARTLSGEAVSREAARGKVVVVHHGAPAEPCL